MSASATGLPAWIAVVASRRDDGARRRLLQRALRATRSRSFADGCDASLPRRGPTACRAGRACFDLLLRRGHWCDTNARATPATRRARRSPRRGPRSTRCARSPPAAGQTRSGSLAALTRRRERLPRRFAERTWTSCRDGRAGARPGDAGRTGRFATCRFPTHTRDAAPFLYYLFYRSPAPFDRLADLRLRRHADRPASPEEQSGICAPGTTA